VNIMSKILSFQRIVLSFCIGFLSLHAADFEELQKLVASDRATEDHFGLSVTISGDVAIVGAYGEDASGLSDAGSAYIFYWNGTSWNQQAKIVASDRAANDLFGYCVSISGNYAIVGAPNENEAGAAYIFMRYGGNWTQQKKNYTFG